LFPDVNRLRPLFRRKLTDGCLARTSPGHRVAAVFLVCGQRKSTWDRPKMGLGDSTYMTPASVPGSPGPCASTRLVRTLHCLARRPVESAGDWSGREIPR
jgi:hypothetical protein